MAAPASPWTVNRPSLGTSQDVLPAIVRLFRCRGRHAVDGLTPRAHELAEVARLLMNAEELLLHAKAGRTPAVELLTARPTTERRGRLRREARLRQLGHRESTTTGRLMPVRLRPRSRAQREPD